MKKSAKLLLFVCALILTLSVGLAACDEAAVKITFTGGSGATGAAPADIDVMLGDKIVLPANTFTYEGHIFTGWNDGSKTYREAEQYTVLTPTAVSFTAVWEAVGSEKPDYALTYAHGAHGTGTAPQATNAKEGDKLTLAAATIFTAEEGYVFGGWTDGTATYAAGSEFTMPAKNVTLTAVWTEIPVTVKHTVTFDPNNGTDEPFTVEVEEGQKVAKPTDPSHSTKEFRFWTLDGVEFNFDTAITGDIELTAKYAYALTFNAGGATGTAPATIYVTAGGALMPSKGDLAKDGFTFGGWKSSADGEIYQPGDRISSVTTSITLTAVWTEIPVTVKHTVTFDPNNGEDAWTVEVDDGQTVAKPATDPTHPTKTFRYWKSDVAEFNFGTAITGDIELTANYAYALTFNAGGATGTVPQTIYVVSGGAIMPPKGDLAKDGYAFGGWKSSKDDAVYAAGDRIASVTTSFTLTAVWIEVIPGYAVTFEKGFYAATGDVPTMENKEKDDVFTLPSSNLARAGYEFAGWKCSVDNKIYQIGDSYTMTAAATKFTAQWTVAKFTVTFIADGATFVTQKVENNKFATAPSPAPTKAGNVFVGWDKVLSETKITRDTTFTAVFMPIVATSEFAGLWVNGAKSLYITENCEVIVDGKYYALMDNTEIGQREVIGSDYSVYLILTLENGGLTCYDANGDSTVEFVSKTEVEPILRDSINGSYKRNGLNTILSVTSDTVKIGTIEYVCKIYGQYVYLQHKTNSGYFFVLTVEEGNLVGFANGTTACTFSKQLEVTYKTGVGMIGETQKVYVDAGTPTFLISNPFRERFGFMFYGWIEESTGKEMSEGDAYIVNADAVFTADYMTAVYVCKNIASNGLAADSVTIMLGGGQITGDVALSMIMMGDQSIEFAYEYDERTGVIVITLLDENGDTTDQVFTGSVVFVAKDSADPESEDTYALNLVLPLESSSAVFGNYAEITYMPGDHSLSTEPIYFYALKGEAFVLESASLFTSAANYVFEGWKKTGSSTLLTAESLLTVTADTVVTASWKELPKGYYALNIAGGAAAAETASIMLDGNGAGEFNYDISQEDFSKYTLPLTYTLDGQTIKITLAGNEFTGTYGGGLLTIDLVYNARTYKFGLPIPAVPTLIFEGGIGTGEAPVMPEIIYDSVNLNYYIILPANTYSEPDNYKFDSWFDGKVNGKPGSKYIIQAGSTVTLTAFYKELSEFVVEEIEGVITLTAYNGTSTAVVIPGDLGIEKISMSAFGTKPFITSIDIPASITYIYPGAFINLKNLSSLKIRNTDAPIVGSGCWTYGGPFGTDHKITIYVPGMFITVDPETKQRAYGDWNEQSYIIMNLDLLEGGNGFVEPVFTQLNGSIFTTTTPIKVIVDAGIKEFTYTKMTFAYDQNLKTATIKLTYVDINGKETTPTTTNFNLFELNPDNTYSVSKSSSSAYKMTVGFTESGEMHVLAFTYKITSGEYSASNVSADAPIVFTKQA